jgi:hypothetical protein
MSLGKFGQVFCNGTEGGELEIRTETGRFLLGFGKDGLPYEFFISTLIFVPDNKLLPIL